MKIIDAYGADITALVRDTAAAANIPIRLLLGTMYGESVTLDPKAERWGIQTDNAILAIADKKVDILQTIITITWPDISFGRAQRIVKFHYHGDLQPTVANCLAVRQYVFDHPEEDLQQMAAKLRGNLAISTANNPVHVDNDPLLGAAVVYNAGHWPVDESEWIARAPRVEHYREAFAKADIALALPDQPIQPVGDKKVTIEEKTVALGNDKLGNGGQPETGIYEIPTNAGPLRLQVFWNGYMLEYTKPDGNTDVQFTLSAEVSAAVAASFQG